MSDLIAAVATGWPAPASAFSVCPATAASPPPPGFFRPSNGRPLTDAPDRHMTLGTLHDADGRLLDACVAVVSHGPHSYTGEDTCEFQCHGSPRRSRRRTARALFARGFRQAGPGEFTRRAFLNGRMDLTQAEAVIDLIDAETADAAANAAGQLGGAMLRKIDPIYMSLVDVCSHFHAVLDYPDEDIEPFELRQHRDVLEKAVNALAAILSTFRRGQRLKTASAPSFSAVRTSANRAFSTRSAAMTA